MRSEDFIGVKVNIVIFCVMTADNFVRGYQCSEEHTASVSHCPEDWGRRFF
jgi:hypothetical protein